ncbi:hypothetical protein [Streptomyces sp. CoT10]|uniref:hypothetical protein n=1 Tax=Streptomyces sp. CoT10 TaxID=2875762 RepID=UPI001CD49320|nr:hypothetical protein [Streptomyces sp. CoT10]
MHAQAGLSAASGAGLATANYLGTPPPPANGSANPVDIPAMRKMGEALNRPMPGATKRGVSAAAARGRSTTTAKRGGRKAAPGGTEQAGHLRRGVGGQPVSVSVSFSPIHQCSSGPPCRLDTVRTRA